MYSYSSRAQTDVDIYNSETLTALDFETCIETPATCLCNYTDTNTTQPHVHFYMTCFSHPYNLTLFVSLQRFKHEKRLNESFFYAELRTSKCVNEHMVNLNKEASKATNQNWRNSQIYIGSANQYCLNKPDKRQSCSTCSSFQLQSHLNYCYTELVQACKYASSTYKQTQTCDK